MIGQKSAYGLSDYACPERNQFVSRFLPCLSLRSSPTGERRGILNLRTYEHISTRHSVALREGWPLLVRAPEPPYHFWQGDPGRRELDHQHVDALNGVKQLVLLGSPMDRLFVIPVVQRGYEPGIHLAH